MGYRLNWSDRAITNLTTIESYIAEDSQFQAQRVINELLDYAEELRTFPLMGPVVLELHDMHLRQIVKYSYRIIYVFNDNIITIVAVLHGRQDMISQFAKRK